MIKDPLDLIEKPLHLLGLHAGWARVGAVLVAALVFVGLLRWWRARQSAS